MQEGSGMKRKMLIMLLAALALALLGCGTAAAERSLSLKDNMITVTPGTPGRLEWTVSGFAPVRLRVMHSWLEGNILDGEYHRTVVKELDTSAVSWDLTYDTARDIMYDSVESLMGSWYLAAYYGSGESDYIPEYFGVDLETGTLTVTSDSVLVTPDEPGTVNWSVTGFTPLRTAVMYSYKEGNNQHTVSVVEADPVSGSVSLPFEEAYGIKREDPFGQWYLFAWYGDGDDEYVSTWFDVEFTTGTLSMTEEEIALQPGEEHLVRWSLDGFEPRKYEVIAQRWENGSICSPTVAEPSVDLGYYYLTFDAAREAMNGYSGIWWFRAYFGNGENDYLEDSFLVSLRTGSAAVETETVYIATDTPGTLRWTTSGFTPVKTEVFYSYPDEGNSSWHTKTIKTLSRGTTYCPLYFDETHGEESSHPLGNWGIRVYYGNDDSDFHYATFVPSYSCGSVSVASETVIVTPGGNNGPTSEGYNIVTWTVDGFTPEKYEIVYSGWEGDILNGSYYETVVIEPHTSAPLYYPDFFETRQIMQNHPGGTWSIRAYYGSGKRDYVSDSFSPLLESGNVFTEPDPLFVAQDTPGHLTWTTAGFTPKQFRLVYAYWEDMYLFGTLRKITVREMNGSAVSCDLSWEEVEDTMDAIPSNAVTGGWYLEAYYGNGSDDYNSCMVDVRYLIRHFITQPTGGNYQGNNGCPVTWETNYPTTAIRIFEVDEAGNPVQDHPVAFSAASSSTSYVIYLPEGKTVCRFRIMASYGPYPEDYILSEPFTVSRYGFSEQPPSGFITGFTEDPDHTPFYRVSWNTTFEPTALYIFSTDENGVSEVGEKAINLRLDAADKQYDIPMPVSGGYERSFRILASFGSSTSDTVLSRVFRATYATVLRYDTEVTLSPGEGGRLCFETNYVPAKAELYLHEPVDDPDPGVLPMEEFELYDTIYPVTTNCWFDVGYGAAMNGSVARMIVQFQRDGATRTVYTTGTQIRKEPAFLEYGGPGGPIAMEQEDYFWGYLNFETTVWEVYRRPAGEEEAEWELVDRVTVEDPRDSIETEVRNIDGVWSSYDYFVRAYTPDGEKWADSGIVQVDFEGNAFVFTGTLDKVYDGEPVTFDPCDADTLLVYGGNRDWADMEEYGEARFIWLCYSEELGGYAGMTDGSVPTSAGRYELVIQEWDGEAWTDVLEVPFEITENAAETRTVTFDSQGGTEVPPQTVDSGETVSEPAAPTKIGSCFGGWFTDAACAEEKRFSFDTPVTADMTLFAKWTIPEPDGFILLPAALTTIETEAFSGIRAEAVILPETVPAPEGNPFAGSSVRYIYGFNGAVQEFASANDYAFILIDDAWMAAYRGKDGGT